MEEYKSPILIKDLGMMFPKNSSSRKYRYGLYKCFCGIEFTSRTSIINGGQTKSCGCLKVVAAKSIATTHGLVHNPLYLKWKSMKQRCLNKNNKRYMNYGGRGITICERWLDVRNFIEDMYPSYQEGLTLDRIDVNGNYEPENCRWTTREVQARNTRDIQINNTSGYRGVSFHKRTSLWNSYIIVNSKQINLGSYGSALDAAKAYETYIRINNLEHNFTPVLSEEEIEKIEK